jgi:hypothetical protein
MMRFAVLLALVGYGTSAHADYFHTLVGIKCNTQTDRLIVYYVGAYNEEGEALIARKNGNEWTPGELIVSMQDDDHIGELKTIVRSCELSQGEYEIHIGPSPGNMNIQGQCGAQLSAWVEIRLYGEVLVPRRDFEPWCHDLDGEVLTRVTIDSVSKNPRFTTIKYDEFFR